MNDEHAGSDQRLFGLLPDPNASLHIVVADGEGAHAVLDLLTQSRSQLKGRTTVVYADTDSAGAKFDLLLQDVDRVIVLPTRLGVIALLDTMIEGPKIGVRLYAAGSGTMVGLVVQLAERKGLDPMSVVLEHWCAVPESA